MNLPFYHNWFNEYTACVRTRIPASEQSVLDEFDMKVQHTFNVQARSEDIARWLNLAGRDFEMASLCGLFHDLGRFEQAEKFGTMDDRVTGSHADISERIFWRDVPRDRLSDRESEILAAALRCHNLFKIPEGLDAETLLYVKLTRDADKLDIFRHVVDLHTGRENRIFRFVHFDIQGEPNPELVNAVLNGENFNTARVKNGQDRRLLEISLIFNLNYGISFQQALDMRFVEALTENADGCWPDVAAYAVNYMRERVTQR